MKITKSIRLLVCGGRAFADEALLVATLDAIHAERGIDEVITGDASGADRMARMWAGKMGLKRWMFSADWKSQGRADGPIRNRKMLVEGKPDEVLAFKGGDGTVNMVDQATKAGVPVTRVEW